MNESRKREVFLNIFGILFLAWGIVAILNSLYQANSDQILWNCYVALLLIGIGILNRNGKLIGSQLVILGIPLLFWDIDFIYYLFNGEPLWGITDYFFLDNFLDVGRVISLQHLFTLPLSLIALAMIKVKKFDFWKVSLVQVSLLFIAALFFTNPDKNTNCVFENCLTVEISKLSHIPYQILWFVILFGLIFFTNYLLYLIDKKYGILRKSKPKRSR